MQNNNVSEEQSFLVFARVRPQPTESISTEVTSSQKLQQSVIKIERNHVYILDPSERKEKPYTFDAVYPQSSSNYHILIKGLQPSLSCILSGYNCTILAYGMTSSGKTHTIFGNQSEKGLAQLSFDWLFKKMQDVKEKQFTCKFSYLEIYNETARDLLAEIQKPLNIIEDGKGVQVQDLSEYFVEQMHQVEELIEMGNKRRVLASTNMNQFSSRSHAILQLSIQAKESVGGIIQQIQYSKLTLIDLAGSEKCLANGKIHLESSNINKSLLALGNCINILVDKSKKHQQGSFVPYRDSKLTRLLKDSLGGNSKTIMIACISPISMCFEETLNTLNYAQRAKNIKKKLTRNFLEMEINQSVPKEKFQIIRRQLEILQILLVSRVICENCHSSIQFCCGAQKDSENLIAIFEEIQNFQTENSFQNSLNQTITNSFNLKKQKLFCNQIILNYLYQDLKNRNQNFVQKFNKYTV